MAAFQHIERGAFSWHERDVSDLLPRTWATTVADFAARTAVVRTLRPHSVTSRECDPDIAIPVMTVGGVALRNGLPWLYDLYRGTFRDLLETVAGEAVSIARDDRYAVNLNMQRGDRTRYECHVDSNPWEGLLYVTTHPPGSGGELVVANRKDAMGPAEIEADCVRIHPAMGKLVFFDAREFPHFVAPLADADAVRIAIAMNFYTVACPESARPADLNRHLFGED